MFRVRNAPRDDESRQTHLNFVRTILGATDSDEPHVSATNVTSKRLQALLGSCFRPAVSCALC